MTPPLHKMPNATPVGLSPTGTLDRKNGVRLLEIGVLGLLGRIHPCFMDTWARRQVSLGIGTWRMPPWQRMREVGIFSAQTWRLSRGIAWAWQLI